MTPGERAKLAARWITQRPPLAYLIAGWVVFTLGSYPGYMSFDSTMQLFAVRNGVYTDTHAPLMTLTWSLLEWIAAGPFPMLALQSGLFLFGAAAVLRTVVSPRKAAVLASCILLFPPVYAPMAVIWRDSLMSGALLAAAGAALQPTWRWKVLSALCLLLAIGCNVEATVAAIPIVLLAIADSAWWQRVGIALAVVAVLACATRVAGWILVDTENYEPQQALMMTDLVGTLRRAKVTNEDALAKALDGLPIADRSALVERMSVTNDALNWWPLAHGDRRILDPITTEEQSEALSAAWRNAIVSHPGAWLFHRWSMTRAMLGIKFQGKWLPIYDSFGNNVLMEPLHHRASASDWQRGWRKFVRLGNRTLPTFRPWFYLLVAAAALVLARKKPEARALRALATSGLLYLVMMALFAPATDYRFAHYFIAASLASLVGVIALKATRGTARPPQA